MPQALEGIRILEWTQFVNGSQFMLGDLGAEVIHIEHRERGDALRGAKRLWEAGLSLPGGRSLAFDALNRSKKSITLDLSKEKGREVLYRLVKNSNAFVHNFRETVAAKLGADYATLSKYNPKLIYVMASGLGTEGPFKDFRSFDNVSQAVSGINWMWGDRDDPEPAQIGGGICDRLGATMASLAVLVGLLAQERQGIGQEIRLSQLSATIWNVATTFYAAMWKGRPMSRHSRTRARNPLSNHYRCADGEWIMLAEPQSDRFWHEFCELLGLGEIEHDARFDSSKKRRESYAELIPILDKTFATRARDEWVNLFMEKKAPFAFAPILRIEEVPNHPQMLENGYFIEDYNHPTLGKVKSLGYPISFSKTPVSYDVPPPEFGQHTEEVLMEVGGYTWEEIEQLRKEEVI